MTAIERAVRRVDYTIRYNGADHLRPEVYNLSWIQYFLLDIQIPLIAITILTVWLLNYVTKYYVCGEGKPWHRVKGLEFHSLGKSAVASGNLPMFDHPHILSPTSGSSTSNFLYSGKTYGVDQPFSPSRSLSSCVCLFPKAAYRKCGCQLSVPGVRLRDLIAAVFHTNHCCTGSSRKLLRLLIKCSDSVMKALRCLFPLHRYNRYSGRSNSNILLPPLLVLRTE